MNIVNDKIAEGWKSQTSADLDTTLVSRPRAGLPAQLHCIWSGTLKSAWDVPFRDRIPQVQRAQPRWANINRDPNHAFKIEKDMENATEN